MSVLRSIPALLALMFALLPVHGSPPLSEMGPRTNPRALIAAAAESQEARVIVKYRSGSNLMQALSAASGARVRPQHAGTLGTRLGLPLRDGRILGERTQALRGDGVTSRELVARLQQQDDVEWAVVDERRYISSAPNDPYYGPNQTAITPAVGQWYLRKPDAAVSSSISTVVSSIDAEAAWAVTPGSAAVTVAVLDTGVIFDHPDLGRAASGGKLWPGYDFVSTGKNISTNDGDGVDPDASDPGDYTTSTSCGSGTAVSSSSWHGTQTAGLVGAATDNATGIASIGRQVMVLPVRVLGPCGGSDSDIIAAMYWAAGINLPGTASNYATYAGIPANPHPAKVISMSLGKLGACPDSYTEVFTALANAQVSVVVAAGNNSAGGIGVEAPANCSGAIAVAALRNVGTKVGFSDLGPEVALAAPGGNCINSSGPCLYPIMSTSNAGSTTPTSNTYTDSTRYAVGTSFSAPLVAGTIGLMLSVDPTLTAAKVLRTLKSTARPFPTAGALSSTAAACIAPNTTPQDECYCTTSTCGAGMLDAGAAVAAVVPPVAPPSTGITASSSTVTAGLSVTLSASGATANGGRSIAGYQWAITSGSGFAAFSGATTAATATLLTSAAGSVVVSLTVTDSAGATGSASTTLTVQAAPATGTGAGTGSTGSSSGGGGGGAMSAGWVALLGLAAWTLRRTRRV